MDTTLLFPIVILVTFLSLLYYLVRAQLAPKNLNKVGEVKFSKSLHEIIATSFGFKLLILFFVALQLLPFGSIAITVLIGQGSSLASWGTWIYVGSFTVVIALVCGIPAVSCIVFLFSQLRFRFYEEGIAINNYFVSKEHLQGYKKESGVLQLFIDTYISGRYGGSWQTTRISIPASRETDQLIPFLDRYKVPSDYAGSAFYQKISYNLVNVWSFKHAPRD